MILNKIGNEKELIEIFIKILLKFFFIYFATSYKFPLFYRTKQWSYPFPIFIYSLSLSISFLRFLYSEKSKGVFYISIKFPVGIDPSFN